MSISQSALIQATYLIFIICLSVFGNLVIIIGIVRRNLLENTTNCFILNLAISDLLNALFKMTTTVASLFDPNWYPSKAICYLTTPFGVLFGAASVLSLTSVSVARYLMIGMPFTYASKVTPSISKFVLIGVWLGSVLLSFPPVIWRPVGIICRSGAVSESYYTSELIYVIFLWLLVIVIPSSVMLFAYTGIYHMTRHHIEHITVSTTFSLERRQLLRRRREARAAMVLALIGGIFILCWLPFFIILTLHKFAAEKIDPMHFKIFMCWMYTNSALNPILLVSFNKEIRNAVRRALRCSTL